MEDKKCEGRTLADMTKEQRKAFIEFLGSDEVRIHWEQCEANGIYDRCPKTDWCAKFNEEKRLKEKEEKEKKEREEQEKSKELETLKARNQVLEDHARTITQEFDNYKKLTEKRFEKLTNLFLSINK